MPIKNAYPELPEIPCTVHAVPMAAIEAYIKTLPYIKEVKRTCHVIVRNETGNGKSFLCNNGAGFQADGNRLPNKWTPFVVGTFIKKENMTGKQRRFVAFKEWNTTIAILADRIFNRGGWIGENIDSNYYKGTVITVDDLAVWYWREWVMGSSISSPDAAFIKDFKNMYNKATSLFV
jgi:hypothetical protein